MAEDVSGRHVSLRRFLMETLGLTQAEAEQTACGMEHDATPLVLDRMALLGEFLRGHPGMLEKWVAERAKAKGARAGRGIGLDELPRGVRGVVLSVDAPAARMPALGVVRAAGARACAPRVALVERRARALA